MLVDSSFGIPSNPPVLSEGDTSLEDTVTSKTRAVEARRFRAVVSNTQLGGRSETRRQVGAGGSSAVGFRFRANARATAVTVLWVERKTAGRRCRVQHSQSPIANVREMPIAELRDRPESIVRNRTFTRLAVARSDALTCRVIPEAEIRHLKPLIVRYRTGFGKALQSAQFEPLSRMDFIHAYGQQCLRQRSSKPVWMQSGGARSEERPSPCLPRIADIEVAVHSDEGFRPLP